jgi:hypothetical protein
MAECYVCLRKYDTAERKPRSLPCGHALCQQCVRAADAVRTRGAADNNPYQPLGCPFCRHPVPDWLALPVNHAVLDVSITAWGHHRMGLLLSSPHSPCFKAPPLVKNKAPSNCYGQTPPHVAIKYSFGLRVHIMWTTCKQCAPCML